MPPDSHAGDRNLLFGIVALQMDFITRDQLIAAMQAWVFDKSKPLVQVLCDQGAFSAEDREAIDSLVRRHLLRHDNNAECSLAALSSSGLNHALAVDQSGSPASTNAAQKCGAA
jgi:hypothetical protein